jgi:hypothetical protein
LAEPTSAASLLGHKALKGYKVIRGLLGRLARKGYRASKELLDNKVFQVQLVCRVHKVRVVIRDPLGPQVLRDRRGSRVQLVPKVHRVLRDQWDRPGLGW